MRTVLIIVGVVVAVAVSVAGYLAGHSAAPGSVDAQRELIAPKQATTSSAEARAAARAVPRGRREGKVTGRQEGERTGARRGRVRAGALTATQEPQATPGETSPTPTSGFPNDCPLGQKPDFATGQCVSNKRTTETPYGLDHGCQGDCDDFKWDPNYPDQIPEVPGVQGE